MRGLRRAELELQVPGDLPDELRVQVQRGQLVAVVLDDLVEAGTQVAQEDRRLLLHDELEADERWNHGLGHMLLQQSADGLLLRLVPGGSCRGRGRVVALLPALSLYLSARARRGQGPAGSFAPPPRVATTLPQSLFRHLLPRSQGGWRGATRRDATRRGGAGRPGRRAPAVCLCACIKIDIS